MQMALAEARQAAADDKRGYHTFCPQPFHPKTEVVGGVLADDCAALMTEFFRRKR